VSVVLDASMAMSFVLQDEFNPRSQRTLALVSEDGALVPHLWDYEVLNSLRSAQARGRLNTADVSHAVSGLFALPITRDPRPADGVRLIDLAHQFALSVYDAAYLSLALDRNLELASLDTALNSAARKAGVKLSR